MVFIPEEEAFDRIESGGVASKPIPAEFGVEGFFFRYEHHFVYWRRLPKGEIGIATILHERMHQIDRFHEDFGLRSGATQRDGHAERSTKGRKVQS